MMEVGVFGATGYTGLELIRLLGRHPNARVRFVASESHAGECLSGVHPAAPELDLVAPDVAALGEVDLVFLALPHTASAPLAVRALDAGARVVDLSADFRLRHAELYAQWYGVEHPYPALLSTAVYGLTEVVRSELPRARLVANPGCYPTSALLALYPLVSAGAVGETVVIDAKSGVSGAGRKPKLATHFVEVADNLSPYSIGRTHRHLPEIEQALSWWSTSPPALVFSPHLLPVPRGLLSTIYVPLRNDWDETAIRGLFQEAYQGEPFIKLLPRGQVATLAHANHSNRCVLGLTMAERMLVITSAIDNLVKGAAGQAIQNMNVMFGFEESAGLC